MWASIGLTHCAAFLHASIVGHRGLIPCLGVLYLFRWSSGRNDGTGDVSYRGARLVRFESGDRRSGERRVPEHMKSGVRALK